MFAWFSVDSYSGLLAVVEGVVHGVVGVRQGHVGRTWDGLEHFSVKRNVIKSLVNVGVKHLAKFY